MKIVSVLNHKGGVGKTTFTGSCAQALALTGFRVLAIDNDGQHNLSTMLGTGGCTPDIRDVYRTEDPDAVSVFLRSIRSTGIPDLHIVTSQAGLADADIRRRDFLRECIVTCRLERFYDYVLIDNAPGMGMLQEAAVCASDEIFVPTELKLFAVDGISEMQRLLTARFPAGPFITKIIPQFYRDTISQNSYRAALEKLYPGRVTRTGIPVDSVFDELVVEKKILFLHRLYSRAAAYYLKVMYEVFDLDEKMTWETLVLKRKRRMREEAVARLMKMRQNKENANSEK
jgi:chromosome partitioning protein